VCTLGCILLGTVVDTVIAQTEDETRCTILDLGGPLKMIGRFYHPEKYGREKPCTGTPRSNPLPAKFKPIGIETAGVGGIFLFLFWQATEWQRD